MLPLMGFSQSHPQYLLTSAFTEVRNPSLLLIPGHCTMSCCQAPSDNKLLIFNWGNCMMYKTKQSQIYLSIGTSIRFSLLLEGLWLLIRLHPFKCIFEQNDLAPHQALHSTVRQCRACRGASPSPVCNRTWQTFRKSWGLYWEAVISPDSVLLGSILSLNCLEPNASAQHISSQSSRG